MTACLQAERCGRTLPRSWTTTRVPVDTRHNTPCRRLACARLHTCLCLCTRTYTPCDKPIGGVSGLAWCCGAREGSDLRLSALTARAKLLQVVLRPPLHLLRARTLAAGPSPRHAPVCALASHQLRRRQGWPGKTQTPVLHWPCPTPAVPTSSAASAAPRARSASSARSCAAAQPASRARSCARSCCTLASPARAATCALRPWTKRPSALTSGQCF